MLKDLLLIVVASVAVFFLFAIIQGIKKAQSMTPQEQQQFLQQYKAEKRRKNELKRLYKRRYNYWYNKSYDHINGCAAQTANKRHEYARQHALDDLYGD